MIAEHNLKLSDREHAVPGVRILLDPQRFADAWGRVTGEGREISAKIEYVRYKPQRRCLVKYRIDFGRESEIVVAQAYDQAGWNKHCQTYDEMTCDVPPTANNELSRSWISAGKFPSDRKLRLMRELQNEADSKRFVRSTIDPFFNEDLFRLKCVAYKPGRRAVYSLRSDVQRQYAVKLFDKTSYPNAVRIARAWDNCRNSLQNNGVEIPNITCVNDRHRLLVTNWLTAANLSRRLSERTVCEHDFERIGAALACLHQSSPIALATKHQPHRRDQVEKLSQDIIFLLPELKKLMTCCVRRLLDALDDLSVASLPIHGDFYAKQVCLDEENVGILDFDQSVLGDPYIDIGNFLAKHIWGGQRGDYQLGNADQLHQAFLSGYQFRRGKLSQRSVDTHLAIGLLKCTPLPFRNGCDEWPQDTHKILEMVHDTIPRRCSNRVSRQTTTLTEHSSPRSEVLTSQLLREFPTAWMANAIIAERAERRIVKSCPALRHLGYDLKVIEVSPIRYKLDKRCLIRYDVCVRQSNSSDIVFSIIGKTRFKGVDRNSFDVQTHLRRSGLNENHPDGVTVPEPLGIDCDSRTWYQRLVPGQTLEQVAETGSTYDLHDACQRTADALECFHHCSLRPGITSYGRDDELQSLLIRLQEVIAECPQWSAEIRMLLRSAKQIYELLTTDCATAIHRDFYHDQILLENDRVHMLDFDLYCRGPRLLDAGNYLAHLWELSLRFPKRRPQWMSTAATFSDAVCQTSVRADLERRQLHAWAWMSLARHVWISRRIASRQYTTESVIHHAMRLSKIILRREEIDDWYADVAR